MKQFVKTVSLILTFVLCLSLLTSCVEDISTQTENPRVEETPSIFDGDCGITASAEIGNNIINFPELKITITNTTDKEIRTFMVRKSKAGQHKRIYIPTHLFPPEKQQQYLIN